MLVIGVQEQHEAVLDLLCAQQVLTLSGPSYTNGRLVLRGYL